MEARAGPKSEACSPRPVGLGKATNVILVHAKGRAIKESRSCGRASDPQAIRELMPNGVVAAGADHLRFAFGYDETRQAGLSGDSSRRAALVSWELVR